MWRWITDQCVELPERDMLEITLAKLADPITGLAEELGIGCDATRESEPLHVVGNEDVARCGEIDARMRGRGGDDRGQVRWKLLERGPLVETGIRPAPEPDLAI